jgi:hypothetical protein
MVTSLPLVGTDPRAVGMNMQNNGAARALVTPRTLFIHPSVIQVR